jgi:hypothetical protein
MKIHDDELLNPEEDNYLPFRESDNLEESEGLLPSLY